MSLSKPTTMSVIAKQYKYKLKAYLNVYFSLVILQIIAMLFSFSSTSSMNFGTQNMNVNIGYYSVDIVIVFSMIWAFITGILLTTKTYRNDNFNFITNRVSNNISNVLFLMTGSIIAGTAAMLSTFLQKVILYYIGGIRFVNATSLLDYPKEILLGIGATILYILLFSSLGYIVGTLVQLHKVFAFIIPVIFFGILFTIESTAPHEFKIKLFEFFFRESSVILFSLKNLIIAALLFTSATVISNRLEVES